MRKAMKHILLLLGLGFGWPLWATSKTVSVGHYYTYDETVYTSSASSGGTREVRASGTVEFTGDYGYVRIILSVSGDKDYLIYECYPLLVEDRVVTFENAHQESSIPEGIGAFQVRVEIESASLYIRTLELRDTSPSPLSIRSAQEAEIKDKIERINANLRSRHMLWYAGETSISGLSFEDKKGLFGGRIPDLQGFEYYRGGIFELVGNQETDNSQIDAADDSFYVDAYDWRARHGANNPSSPYYNPGSPDGWITPVRDQKGCGSCWAFGTVGVVEACANLYFNRFLNPDLSEQEIVSCNTDAGSCHGGLPIEATQYIKNNGIVDESCFPYASLYTTSAIPCAEKCSQPTIITGIGGTYAYNYDTLIKQNKNPENEMKSKLIQAPIAGWFHSLGHVMTIVGYKKLKSGDTIYDPESQKVITVNPDDSRIGKTIWICKNSYTTNFGENGYLSYLKKDGSMRDLHLSSSIILPVTRTHYSEADIVCEDRDGDGYYWWGIGPKPSTCPPDILEEPDGDDSDPALGPMDEYGHIAAITPHVYPATEITTTVCWAGSSYLNGNLIIRSGGQLTLTGNLIMPHHCKVEIHQGGCLMVDGGHILRGDIKVRKGGRLEMKNNAVVEMVKDDRLHTESGGIVCMPYGQLKNTD